MKKTNKGFSLVELIIVIAIMAILAGALAPALIKYINKSRLSTDVQTASSIATACQAAIATEAGYDASATYKTATTLATIYGATDACAEAIKETCSGVGAVAADAPKLKGKKCLVNYTDAAGAKQTCAKAYGGDFNIQIDADNNKIVITESTGNHELYPNAEGCITG